ncbi:MAG: ABC transporter permease [Anaerolineae bacterium]|nr:ABC transporter permease [Anaerolineae bacterium]
MVWRSLWRRRARSFLTILGVAIGVAAVVVLGAMAEGLAQGYAGMASDTDLLVMQANVYDITLSALEEDLGSRIAQLPGVRSVSGVIVGLVALEKVPYFFVNGHDPESTSIQRFRIVQGNRLIRPGQMLLGRQAAANLEKSVGDTVRLFGRPFIVVGIYETGQLFEDNGAVISLSDAQRLLKKSHRVSFFEVSLYNLSEVDKAKHLIEELAPGVSVTRASDLADEQQTVETIRGMAWGISMIAILIGGLGMMNTMMMAVFEQTREIGVLRALGWCRPHILRLILGQSVSLGLLGGLFGISMGLGLIWVVNRTPAIASIAPATLRAELLLQGLVMALILGLVGGIYPAWRAASLMPIEALRYEMGAETRREPAWMLHLSMTLRAVWRRRTRSLLTMIGIAIGSALILSLGAITEGSIQQLNAFVSRGGAELVAVQAGVADMGYSVVDERVGRAIAAMPEVAYVSGILWGVSTGEKLPFLFILGIDPADPSLSRYRIVQGRYIMARHEVMLGHTAARNLKKKVGDTIILPGGVYRVVGIFETGTAYEDAAGVIALREAQRAFQKRHQVSLYQIKLRDPSQAQAVRDRIEARLGDEVSVSLSATFGENLTDFQNAQAMMNAVFALALIVGGIVVTNTMMMSVMERTREIGTLRALGWCRARVLWMVLSEALVLSGLAGGIGLLVGFALTRMLQSVPDFGAFLTAVYTPQLVGQSLAIALLLGLAGGLYPAWCAAQLQPVEALRYE